MPSDPRPAPSRVAAAPLSALLLLNGYLLSPVALGALSSHLNFGQHDKLLLFTVPASVLCLCALQLWVSRPLRLHLALLPFYVTVGADLYLLSHYETRLTSSSISVLLDNQEHARDFVAARARSIFVPLGVGAVLYALLLTRLRGVHFDFPRRLRLAGTALLAALYLLVGAKQLRAHGSLGQAALDTASHDQSSPLGVLPQSLIAYVVYRDSLRHQDNLGSFRFGASRQGPAEPRVVVVVLGESSRPDHWSLYGYPRDTTPRLRARSGLLAFRDVTAEAALTKISVPLILTRANADSLPVLEREKSIVAAYREAGYRTAWFSTQQRDQWTGAINRYSAEADSQLFFERRHDAVLLDAVEGWLGAPEQRGRSALLVLHTQGSHFVYDDRYPAQFERYTGARDDKQRLIDSYDNSILYTDFVLDALMERLEADGRAAALLYVSDHGENLRDDSRELFGHFLCNDKDIPVPMLLWFSPAFASAEAPRIAAARALLAARLSTAAVFDTLLDLGGIVISGHATATHSLLQASFRERSRLMAIDEHTIVDFDARYGPGAAAAQPTPAAAP